MAAPLTFTGYEKAHTKESSAEEIRKQAGSSEENGYFYYDGEWDDPDGSIIVKFKPVILINSSLGKAAHRDVLEHEQRHFDDFKRRAVEFRAALLAAIKAKREPEMESRWAWFEYDVRRDFNAFHRQIGRIVTDMVLPPNGERPKD